jgi:hypothetical protein
VADQGERVRRRGWIALVAVIVVVVGAPIVATAPLPSGSLVAVAERFTPDDGATLVADASEPRRLLCLGGQACPSVSRVWELSDRASSEDVQAWLDDAGYDAEVDGDCGSGSCRVRGTADNWQVSVFVTTPDPDGPSRLSFSLRS